MEIQIFENVQFGQLRGMNVNGEAWLMGTDVARRLGYANPQKAIRDHVDEEDKTLNESFTVNGTTPVLINESGLYSLILSSKLPQAKEFKHWVTSEVLPQIRQTGGYIPIGSEEGRGKSEESSEQEILSRALLIAHKTIELKSRLLDQQKPKVQFADAVTSCEDSILIRDLAKLITQNGVEIGQGRLFYWLRLHGYLFQRETRPIQKWVEEGIFDTNVSLVQTHHGLKERITTKVTGKGQRYFIDGFLSGRFCAENGKF